MDALRQSPLELEAQKEFYQEIGFEWQDFIPIYGMIHFTNRALPIERKILQRKSLSEDTSDIGFTQRIILTQIGVLAGPVSVYGAAHGLYSLASLLFK